MLTPHTLSMYLLNTLNEYMKAPSKFVSPIVIITSNKIADIVKNEGISLDPVRRTVLGYRWIESDGHAIIIMRCNPEESDKDILGYSHVNHVLKNPVLPNYFPELKS